MKSSKKIKEMLFNELSKPEMKIILELRKKEYLRQYKFILQRHIDDDNSYKIDHCLRSNLPMFAKQLTYIDNMMKKHGLIDQPISSDDIPF